MSQPVPDWVPFDAEKATGLDLLALRAPVQLISNELFNGGHLRRRFFGTRNVSNRPQPSVERFRPYSGPYLREDCTRMGTNAREFRRTARACGAGVS
jgi:hypothetical protein